MVAIILKINQWSSVTLDHGRYNLSKGNEETVWVVLAIISCELGVFNVLTAKRYDACHTCFSVY